MAWDSGATRRSGWDGESSGYNGSGEERIVVGFDGIVGAGSYALAGVERSEGWGTAAEDDFVVGFTVDVETGDLAGFAVRAVAFEAKDLGIVARMVVELFVLQETDGMGPGGRIGQVG